MSAEIIQFVPRPRKQRAPLTNPIDFTIWYAEATADWMKQMAALGEVIDSEPDEKNPA